MAQRAVGGGSKRIWWVAVLLLGAALVIDVMDGEPLKLATSAVLFAGCLLSALLPLPRPAAGSVAVVACFAAGIALMGYRLLFAGA